MVVLLPRASRVTLAFFSRSAYSRSNSALDGSLMVGKRFWYSPRACSLNCCGCYEGRTRIAKVCRTSPTQPQENRPVASSVNTGIVSLLYSMMQRRRSDVNDSPSVHRPLVFRKKRGGARDWLEKRAGKFVKLGHLEEVKAVSSSQRRAVGALTAAPRRSFQSRHVACSDS